MKTVSFKIWRGDTSGGKSVDYTTEVTEGMVVLDVVHKLVTQANDLATAAGTARRASAAFLFGGNPTACRA